MEKNSSFTTTNNSSSNKESNVPKEKWSYSAADCCDCDLTGQHPEGNKRYVTLQQSRMMIKRIVQTQQTFPGSIKVKKTWESDSRLALVHL